MTAIEALEQRIAELEAKNKLQERQLEKYEQAYATLKHQFQQSLRHRFGSRSERFIDPDHPQAGLFDAALTNESTDNQEEENLPDNVVTIASYQRKKKGRGKLNPDLPRSTVIINVPDEERICPCGCKKVFMRYITTERYDYRPEECAVAEEKREVLVCPNKDCRPSIIAAPKPLHIAPKIQATQEFLAHIIISKLLDRQPLYHLAKKLQTRHGVDISRETLSDWFIKTALPLQPIWNLLKDQYLAYDIAPFDATTLQVLKEPRRLATTKSYVSTGIYSSTGCSTKICGYTISTSCTACGTRTSTSNKQRLVTSFTNNKSSTTGATPSSVVIVGSCTTLSYSYGHNFTLG